MKRFYELSGILHERLMFHSGYIPGMADEELSEIIEMDEDAIQFVIEELRKGNRYFWWFYILGEISGENPVEYFHRGYIDKMAEDWIEWGKSR